MSYMPWTTWGVLVLGPVLLFSAVFENIPPRTCQIRVQYLVLNELRGDTVLRRRNLGMSMFTTYIQHPALGCFCFQFSSVRYS
ncbi:hypothetical protein B0H21DRAFT_742047 [Amylocystis lapponica]|nr:hypothetical protein B0H21DRAFT_742047 [Amylocystis lapponica]